MCFTPFSRRLNYIPKETLMTPSDITTYFVHRALRRWSLGTYFVTRWIFFPKIPSFERVGKQISGLLWFLVLQRRERRERNSLIFFFSRGGVGCPPPPRPIWEGGFFWVASFFPQQRDFSTNSHPPPQRGGSPRTSAPSSLTPSAPFSFCGGCLRPSHLFFWHAFFCKQRPPFPFF